MATKQNSGGKDSDRDSRSSHDSDIDTFPLQLTNADNTDGVADLDPVKNAEALGLITQNSVHSDTDGKHVKVGETEHEKPPTKCAKCRSWCLIKCHPCMTDYNPLPSNATRIQRVQYACMCPPHGHVGRVIALIIAIVLFWASLWGITGPHALPGGNFFALIVLVILCYIGGAVVKLIKLPGLLGE